MIYHTATDPIYFNTYYIKFFSLIKKYSPAAKFSLAFIGSPSSEVINFCNDNNIILTIDNKSLSDISIQYSQPEEECFGYYAISRWCTIPALNEPVFVSDVDFFAINNINETEIIHHLKTADAVNITRLKPNGTHGGMASIVLSPTICQDISNYAINVLNSNRIAWDMDVLVRTYIYETYDIFELNGKVLDVSKKSFQRENLDEWFVLSKGGRDTDVKINRVNAFLTNNNRENL